MDPKSLTGKNLWASGSNGSPRGTSQKTVFFLPEKSTNGFLKRLAKNSGFHGPGVDRDLYLLYWPLEGQIPPRGFPGPRAKAVF